MEDEVAKVLERVRDPKQHGFTARELSLIGCWPPKKGWRKRVLGVSTKKAKKPTNSWPEGEEGYLVRVTGSGRHHYYRGGEALCRSVKSKARYMFTASKPENELCATCADLSDRDPRNSRLTQKGFYQSWEWKKARYETILRYGNKCMCCGFEGSIVVDHIKPLRLYPELALDLENLQVLCRDCNMGKSYDDETDFRPKDGELSHAEREELERVSEARRHLH